MEPISVKQLKARLEEDSMVYEEDVDQAIEQGVPALVYVAEHRGSGLLYFDGEKFYTFPEFDGGNEYITVPLWWFHEQETLEPEILTEACLHSGIYEIEIIPGLLVGPDLNGNVFITTDPTDPSASVQVTPHETDKLPSINYDEVKISDLMHPVEIKYGDNVLLITESDIYLNGEGLTV
jgi:hypothetical protein